MMKIIRTYIRAFFSLGWLGMVITLMALVMLFAAFSQESTPFDSAIERTTVLQSMQSEISLSLAEMQTKQAEEIFSLSYGLESSGAFNQAQQARQHILQTLAELKDDDSFYEDEEIYISDLTGELNDFEATLAQNWQIFEFITQEFDQIDDQEWFDALLELEENQETLNLRLRDLILIIEKDRQRALADFPEDADASIFIIVVAMAFTLIFALIGYQIIASTVQPLGTLRNTITSIAGDVYRPGSELPQGTAKSLANALQELAEAEQIRNQNSKQEIENLRQELYESRRRRLKIHQPEKKPE
jgi:hypothetical protein